MVYFAFSVHYGAAVVKFYMLLDFTFCGHALLFGITRSIVHNVHHKTKKNLNEECIATRHSRVKENFFCLAC